MNEEEEKNSEVFTTFQLSNYGCSLKLATVVWLIESTGPDYRWYKIPLVNLDRNSCPI